GSRRRADRRDHGRPLDLDPLRLLRTDPRGPVPRSGPTHFEAGPCAYRTGDLRIRIAAFRRKSARSRRRTMTVPARRKKTTMRMVFAGCVECGARTTNIDGLCPDCDARRTAVRARTPAERRGRV